MLAAVFNVFSFILAVIGETVKSVFKMAFVAGAACVAALFVIVYFVNALVR